MSESESTRFAGVTLDTLRQYERFGLLQSVRKDNEVFYRENDLRTVFGVNESSRSPESNSEQPLTQPNVAQAPQQFPNPEPPRTEGNPIHTATVEPERVPPAAAQSQFEQTQGQDFHQFRPQNPTFDSGVTYSHPQSPGVFEMLESNKTLREQIQILKDERDWLRKRVEKLETRTERDQMLLIAENETVKGLMHQLPAPAPRRSFWQISLPWLRPDK